jgi:MFS family permease
MNRNQKLEANIWKYYVIRTFAKRLVWPILTLFLLRNSLTASEIGIIFAVGSVLGLIAEVPGGIVADKIGRKNSLAIAGISWALSMLLFYIGHSFQAFLIAQATYTLGSSLWTGIGEAFIYETLDELGKSSDIKKVHGKALFISQFTTGIIFVAVPIIAKYSLKLPFLLNTIVFILMTLLILTLTEPKKESIVGKKNFINDFLGFKLFFSNKLLLYSCLFFASTSGINFFLESYRQIQMDRVIHLDIVYFGLVYMALRILTGVFGLFAERFEKAIGKKPLLLITVLLNFLTYLGLAYISSLWALIFLVLDGVQDGLSRPLEQEYVNKAVSHNRATMLSIANLLQNLLGAAVVFVGGILIDHVGIQKSFLFPTMLMLIIMTPLTWAFFKVGAKHNIFKPS